METVDLARLLLDLLIVVAAAKLAAEGAERIGVPAVLGEIVAGILIGPSALGLVELHGERGVSLGVLAEIGVLLLLVHVGMEMDLAELGRVGRASMAVAVIGVAVPFLAGTVAGVGLGWATETAVFLGAALTATSVGITARVFGDLKALATTEARIVLGAAVADDVLGLIILTVVVKAVTGDAVTVGVVASTVLVALAFVVGSGVLGIVGVPRLLRVVDRYARSGTTLTVVALAVILGLAVLADLAQLAFIIGAFVAGLALGRSEHQERIAVDLHSVGAVLIPVFFVLIGVNADLEAMLQPSVLLDASILFAVAVAGKLVAAYGASGTRADRLLVGIGMIPRGEVGLIFASIGLAQGVLDDELYGALLLVVLLTTVVTPPLLRWRIGRGVRHDIVGTDAEDASEPADGWVTVRDGELVLNGRPSTRALVPVALRAAALVGGGRPSDDLLSWFGDRRDVDVRWTAEDTAALLDVLRHGDPRAVRLLELTGLLERGVPSIVVALARRRADPSELDPSHVLRFPTVGRLDELLIEADAGHAPACRQHERVDILAALALDVAGVDVDRAALSGLLSELAVEDPTPVERRIEGARLLRAAAGDLDGYSQGELRQLADRIGSMATLSSAHLLAVASTHDDDRRDRLDQLHGLVADLLSHPDLLGDAATSLAEGRRAAAQALATGRAAASRLQAASDGYVLAHEPEELARQARLIEPLPPRGTVRVAVSPEGTPEHWIVDVACRDADALLAHLAAALTAAGCDIAAATVATWPDGAAIDNFLVRSAVRPRARTLALEMESALDRTVHVEPLTDLQIRFDNESVPWHTSCTVRGRDRPGTLAALAGAFAAAGAVVHSARITRVDGEMVDRFALGDRLGRKLDDATMSRIRATLAGAPAKRARVSLRR